VSDDFLDAELPFEHLPVYVLSQTIHIMDLSYSLHTVPTTWLKSSSRPSRTATPVFVLNASFSLLLIAIYLSTLSMTPSSPFLTEARASTEA
jgi:hypothetical protein